MEGIDLIYSMIIPSSSSSSSYTQRGREWERYGSTGFLTTFMIFVLGIVYNLPSPSRVHRGNGCAKAGLGWAGLENMGEGVFLSEYAGYGEVGGRKYPLMRKRKRKDRNGEK